jgi:aspartate beta-hydroxylase
LPTANTLWDDTFPHEVTNDSNEVRTVLLLDVWRRGMPLDMRLLSRLLIFVVRVMARLRGVGELRHQADRSD